MSYDNNLGSRIGLLGELDVEMRLVENGWHPVRLDTAQMASNADLLAVNKRQRVSIQVKTTDAFKKHSHKDWLGFGYSTNYLREKKPIFNSKISPLITDVVIGVSYYPQQSRFVIMPVAFAESLCRFHCDYYSQIPTKTETGKRSDSFPIYLCFKATRESHQDHHERVKRNLLRFENAWDVLNEPVANLHDHAKWPLQP